jgi:hypothetical protein
MTQTNIYTDTFLDSGIVKLGILQNIIHYLALKKNYARLGTKNATYIANIT